MSDNQTNPLEEFIDNAQWNDLFLVLSRLKNWYTAKEALEYLSLPHPLIPTDPEMPCIHLIMTGRADEIIKTIDQMDEGVYL